MNWDYPEEPYEDRERIRADHLNYTASLLFLANDDRVPKSVRESLNEWGLCKDEFSDTGFWPHQLYVREARRMTGEYVVTQKDLQTELTKPDAIGMGSYNSDSHAVQRYLLADGTAQNEGLMEVPVQPYQIPYRVMLPKRSEAVNLLVPVAFSASHVAYSSLRMEPQYMIIGQAAAVTAKLAIANRCDVQSVDTTALRDILRQHGAVFRTTPRLSLRPTEAATACRSVCEWFKAATGCTTFWMHCGGGLSIYSTKGVSCPAPASMTNRWRSVRSCGPLNPSWSRTKHSGP